MMSTTIAEQVDELHRLIEALRCCVTALAAAHGDTAATRRVVNDAERIQNGIDRLDIDAHELESACAHRQSKRSAAMIPVPDTEYGSEFWRDVDHEGVGGRCGLPQ
jgi:hypothetical protein